MIAGSPGRHEPERPPRGHEAISTVPGPRGGRAIRRGYATGPFGQIHYAIAGRGDPLLLVHQTPRSWDEYAAIMELLSGRRLTIAMDLPGMGASDPPSGPATIEDFADAAVALLDELGLERVDVFGHHTGSFVAADLCARRGDRVRSVILSAPTWVDEASRLANPDGGDLKVDNAEMVESGDHVLELWRQRQRFYPPGRPDLLSTFLRDALRVRDPREGHLACARYSLERAIAEIRCPVLLLGHDADPHSFADLAQFTARLPQAAVTVIEGGMVPLEFAAPQVAAAIEAFLAP